MNGRAYSVRVEGAKYGVSFGSALAIAISYTTNHSILWAIIHLRLAVCHLFRAVPRMRSGHSRSLYLPTTK
jgi:hypothetical protein